MARPELIDGARRGFAEQRLQFGEGVLDRVEVGRVGREEQQPARRPPRSPRARPRPCGRAGCRGSRRRRPSASARAPARRRPGTSSPVIGPSSTIGAVIPVSRRRADEGGRLPVAVRDRRMRSRWPRAARPWRRAILVLAPVSSMNTSASGSRSSSPSNQASPAVSGRRDDGLSEISCCGGHDEGEGGPTCRAAKSRRSRT